MATGGSGDELFVELGDGTIEATLPAQPEAVGLARRYVHTRWAQFGDDTLDDVDLIVSELVTNALKHGAPEIVFRVRVEPFAIDIEVLDHGMELPRARPAADHDSSGGRGLQIVERLAASWGYERLHGEAGKVVWASVDLAGLQ